MWQLLSLIYGFLKPREVAEAQLVCKKWRVRALWKRLVVTSAHNLVHTTQACFHAAVEECNLEFGVSKLDFVRMEKLTNLQVAKRCYGGVPRSSNQSFDMHLLPEVAPNLQVLDFGDAIKPLDSWLAHIAKLPQLTTLTFGQCNNITDAGLAHLVDTPLRCLALFEFSKVTSVGIGHIARLTSLRKLKLRASSLGRHGVALIGTLPHLEELDIATSSGLQGLLSLAPTLQQLSVTHHHDPDDADQDLLHVSMLVNLRNLSLRCMDHVTTAGFAHIATLKKLETLLIDRSPIDDQGVKFLSTIATLKNLSFSECQEITHAGVEHISSMPLVEALSFTWFTEITGPWLQIVAEMPTIRHLTVTQSETVDDASLSHIARMLQLRTLNLQDCSKITSAGLLHLASLQQLEDLNLANTAVTDQGFVIVGEMHSLRFVNVSNCKKLTEQGLCQSMGVEKVRYLDEFELHWTRCQPFGDFPKIICVQKSQ